MKTALKGLVLARGSSRMGVSKAEINQHGKQQQYYLAELLSFCCKEVFISCREKPVTVIDPNYKTLADQYKNSGLLAAISTAFERDPNCGLIIFHSKKFCLQIMQK